jgi:hypothetical protein
LLIFASQLTSCQEHGQRSKASTNATQTAARATGGEGDSIECSAEEKQLSADDLRTEGPLSEPLKTPRPFRGHTLTLPDRQHDREPASRRSNRLRRKPPDSSQLALLGGSDAQRPDRGIGSGRGCRDRVARLMGGKSLALCLAR